MSSFSRFGQLPSSRTTARVPAATTKAKAMFTKRDQRQLRYSVRTPPRIRPTAEPLPAIALNTPKALARSPGSVKVTASRERPAGASRAPNTPCRARAVSSMPALMATPPRAEAGPKPITEGPLAADGVADPAAGQQQSAEGEHVGGDDPLPVAVGDAERPLGGGQGDVHDGGVHRDHQLCDGDVEPSAAGPRATVAAGGAAVRASAMTVLTSGTAGCLVADLSDVVNLPQPQVI